MLTTSVTTMSNQKVVSSITSALLKISEELQVHGGGVSLLDFKDGIAYIEFLGACLGCPASSCGLLANFEQRLKTLVPEVKKIVVM